MKKFMMLLSLMIGLQANAASTPPGSLFTYEGLLTDSSGIPITTSKTVTFQVLLGSCILLEETQTVTPGTAGEFSVIVGTGSRVDSTGNTADRIFGSSGSVNCKDSSAVSLTGFATRSLHIIVGGVDLSPDVTIGNIPMAINSQKLADKSVSDFLLKAGIPSCGANTFLSWDGSALTCQAVSGANGGTVMNVTSANGDISVANGTSTPVLTLNSGTGANQIVKLDSSGKLPALDGSNLTNLPAGAAITALTGDVTASGAGSAAATVNSVGGSTAANLHAAEVAANAAATNNVASTIVKRDASGNFTAGTITANLNGAALSNVLKTGDAMTGSLTHAASTGNIYTAGSGTNTVSLQGPSSAIGTSYILRLPTGQGTSNQVMTNDGSGNLSWTSLSSLGVTNVSVTSPITNLGTASLPNIGIQQATTSQSGYLSSTDWNTFNNKVGTSLTAANLLVGNGSNVATAVLPSGDISMTTTGVFTVTKLQNSSISATAPSTAGQVLRWNGANWSPNFVSMFDLRSTITGTQAFGGVGCTAGQTLTWTAATDNLSCTSISLPAGQITGTIAAAQMPAFSGDVISSAGSTTLTLANSGATAGTYKSVTVDAKGRVTSATNPTTVAGFGITDAAVLTGASGGQVLQGGVAAIESLTLDSTSNATKGNVLINPAGGKVGIGTTSPSAYLTIQGAGSSSGQLQLKDSAYPLSNAAYRSHIQALDSSSSTVWYVGDTSASAQDVSFGTTASSGYSLNLDTNGLTRFRIQPDGAIGINTTTANLNGTGSGPGTVTISGSGASATDTGYLELNNPMTPAVGTIGGKISFNASQNNGSKTLSSIQSTVIGNGGTNGFGGQLIFSTKPDNSISVNMMIMNNLGYLGIGGTPTYKLDVFGDANLSSGSVFRIAGTQICSGSGCTSSSDRRLKENIQPLSNSLEKLLQLQGVEYDYVDKNKFGDQHQIGVIAQDVEKVFPEVVVTDSKTTLKSVAYDHLVAPIIESIKVLYSHLVDLRSQQNTQARQIASKAEQADLEALKAESMIKDQRIQSLEQENAAIRARLEKIEKSLNAK